MAALGREEQYSPNTATKVPLPRSLHPLALASSQTFINYTLSTLVPNVLNMYSRRAVSGKFPEVLSMGRETCFVGQVVF